LLFECGECGKCGKCGEKEEKLNNCISTNAALPPTPPTPPTPFQQGGFSFSSVPFPLVPLSPVLAYSPLFINKTDTSQEISNCGVGKIARLKQNNIRNLTSSVNRGTTIKTDKCFMLQQERITKLCPT
jgi:hypothetical protein